MDFPELQSCSFIIKVWLEERCEETGQVLWRGHITHVPSGKRCYLKDLKDIITFIASYMEAMDAGSEMGYIRQE